MIKSISIFFLITVSLSRPEKPAEAYIPGTQDPLERGKFFYSNRAKGAWKDCAKNGPIDSAIYFFKQAFKADSTQERAAAWIMESLLFKSNHTCRSKDEQKDIHNQGLQIFRSLRKKYPKSAPLRYWAAAHWGGWAYSSGILAAARKGVAGKIKDLAEKSLKMDPEYRKGSAHMILGKVHHSAPKIPFILNWPSNKKAIKHLRIAVAGYPSGIKAKLFLAEVLLDEKEEKEAVALLKVIASGPPDPFYIFETKKDIRKAKELLKKFKD